jgi:hypothetical protein
MRVGGSYLLEVFLRLCRSRPPGSSRP